MLSEEEIRDRLRVEDAVVRMFVATDERDWRTLEMCFTNPFVLDMTSMTGGDPVRMSPQQVAQAWAEAFKPIDYVHHQIGNLQTRVTGSRAEVRCHGTAFHHRSNVSSGLKTRIFVGTYALQLDRVEGSWLINRLEFKLKFIDGNLKL